MESRERTYFGVDVVRQGPKLGNYVYSVAIVREGRVVKVDEVPAARLIRLLWEFKPVVVAVDNILELGGSVRNLLRFLKLLPPDTRIVQVNVGEDGVRDVRTVARQVGLEVPHGKLSPRLTAIVVAILASRGVGEEVEVFGKKVKIYVHRGRSGRAGGSSEARFKRNLRAAVAQVVRKIEERLKSRSIDYDLTIRRSRGGIDSAVFTVYSDPESIRGLVREESGYDVVVRIRPVLNPQLLRNLLLSRPAAQRYLIVGIDPGIEVGIAAIDLNGNVVLLKSGRGLDREDVISIIRNLGRCLVVATDKCQPPDFVRKVAAALGARVYFPERDLEVSEKEFAVSKYAEEHGVEVRNTHIRDALAAALEAYRYLESKARELEERLAEMGLDPLALDLGKYKAKLIEGSTIAEVVEELIEESLGEVESYTQAPESSHAPRPAESDESLKSRIRRLESYISSLEAERRELIARVRSLEEELTRLNQAVESRLNSISQSLLKDRKVYELTQRLLNAIRDLDNYRYEYAKLRESYYKLVGLLPEVALGEVLVLRKVPSVGSLLRLDPLRQGETVYVERVSLEELRGALDFLQRSELRILVPDSVPDEVVERAIEELAIPVAKAVDLGGIEGVALVRSSVMSVLSSAVERVTEIRKARELERRILSLEDVERIIAEYRLNRSLERNKES
jgi:predicted RNase H-like nuclease (RuvC/YqgF family)